MHGRILVAIDTSMVSDDGVLERAARLALERGAELHVIGVQEPPPPFQLVAQEVEWLPQAPLDEYLEETESLIRRTLGKTGVRLGSIEVFKGNPAKAILRHTKERGFDFVVLGRRGEGLAHRLRLGSTVHKVVACCNCPVIVFPSTPPPSETSPQRPYGERRSVGSVR